jgi:hypothetical protein
VCLLDAQSAVDSVSRPTKDFVGFTERPWDLRSTCVYDWRPDGASVWRDFASVASAESECIMKTLATTAVVLALTWLAGLAVVRSLGPTLPADALLAVLYLIALLVSLYLRAGIAGFLLAGFSAYFVVSLAAHVLWGPHAFQGRPAHMAVIGAGFLGVALGRGISGDVVRRQLARLITPAPSD